MPLASAAAVLSLAMASGALASAQTTAPDVEVTGVVREIHGETYANGQVREIDERFTVDTASGPVPLAVPDGGRHLALGHEMRLHGHMSGRTFVVAANGASKTGGGATVAATTGTKTVGGHPLQLHQRHQPAMDTLPGPGRGVR